MLLTLLLDPTFWPTTGELLGSLGRVGLGLLVVGLSVYWGLRLWGSHIGKQFERGEPRQAWRPAATSFRTRLPRTRYWVSFLVSMALLWALVGILTL